MGLIPGRKATSLEWKDGTHLYDPILIAEQNGYIFHVHREPDANGNYQWRVQNREDVGVTEVGGASETQDMAKLDCWMARMKLGAVTHLRRIK